MAEKDFNVDEIVAQLDQEFAEEEPSSETQDEEVSEEPVEEVQEEEPEEEPTEEEPEEEPEEEAIQDPNIHKRNEAFRKLREERDQLAASDQFLNNLAEQYGMTKEQLIQQYTDQLNQKEAEKQGIDPEQYKRMKELEDKVQELEIAKERELFNIKAEQMAARYNLKEADMVNLFKEASKMNINITSNPDLLEFVYKSLNYDKAIEEGRQKQLETSKKRKSTSTGATGTQNAQAGDFGEAEMEKEIEAFLKEQGIINSKK